MMRALIAALLLGAALVSLSGSSNAAYRLLSGVGAGPKSSGSNPNCLLLEGTTTDCLLLTGTTTNSLLL